MTSNQDLMSLKFECRDNFKKRKSFKDFPFLIRLVIISIWISKVIYLVFCTFPLIFDLDLPRFFPTCSTRWQIFIGHYRLICISLLNQVHLHSYVLPKKSHRVNKKKTFPLFTNEFYFNLDPVFYIKRSKMFTPLPVITTSHSPNVLYQSCELWSFLFPLAHLRIVRQRPFLPWLALPCL